MSQALQSVRFHFPPEPQGPQYLSHAGEEWGDESGPSTAVFPLLNSHSLAPGRGVQLPSPPQLFPNCTELSPGRVGSAGASPPAERTVRGRSSGSSGCWRRGHARQPLDSRKKKAVPCAWGPPTAGSDKARALMPCGFLVTPQSLPALMENPLDPRGSRHG